MKYPQQPEIIPAQLILSYLLFFQISIQNICQWLNLMLGRFLHTTREFHVSNWEILPQIEINFNFSNIMAISYQSILYYVF